MKKLALLSAAAVGYVLGARAGHERYEQIRRSFLRVKNNPTVQDTTRAAATTAKDAVSTAAPVVKDKVVEGASAVKDKVTGDSGPDLEESAYPVK